MKTLLAFTAGFLAGLAIYQGPKLIAPLFQDEPRTPPGHLPRTRYWNGGVEILDWSPTPEADPDSFERNS